MEEKIKQYLKTIEQERNITILLACETGSRAWGFPSADSDYDVRIIYKHTTDWYLSLKEEKDTIELMLEDNEIDITGWDIRKALRLLWKSNPPLLERIQSPILYKCDQSFLTQIHLLANKCYSKIATIHHYLSMAKNSLAEIESTEEYKLKKFFYTLRAAVACQWILHKNGLPPIEFPKMLDGLAVDQVLRLRIDALIELKSTKSEAYMHRGEGDLFDYIKQSINAAEHEAKRLTAAAGSFSDLNDFFRRAIK